MRVVGLALDHLQVLLLGLHACCHNRVFSIQEKRVLPPALDFSNVSGEPHRQLHQVAAHLGQALFVAAGFASLPLAAPAALALEPAS